MFIQIKILFDNSMYKILKSFTIYFIVYDFYLSSQKIFLNNKKAGKSRFLSIIGVNQVC